MVFCGQEHWSGLPCQPPRHVPNPGIEIAPLKSPALVSGFFTTGANWEAPLCPWHLRDISSLSARFATSKWAARCHCAFSVRHSTPSTNHEFISQVSFQFSSAAHSCPTLCNPMPHVTAACQAFLSITNSQSSPKLMSIESVMPSNHLIL